MAFVEGAGLPKAQGAFSCLDSLVPTFGFGPSPARKSGEHTIAGKPFSCDRGQNEMRDSFRQRACACEEAELYEDLGLACQGRFGSLPVNEGGGVGNAIRPIGVIQGAARMQPVDAAIEIIRLFREV